MFYCYYCYCLHQNYLYYRNFTILKKSWNAFSANTDFNIYLFCILSFLWWRDLSLCHRRNNYEITFLSNLRYIWGTIKKWRHRKNDTFGLPFSLTNICHCFLLVSSFISIVDPEDDIVNSFRSHGARESLSSLPQ